MKTQSAIFALLIISIVHLSHAQSCSKMKDWVTQSEKYGPERFRRMGDRQMAETYGLALHDENFVPVFGKSFSKMSLSARKKVYKKMFECFGDRPFVKYGFAYAFYGPHNGQDPWNDVAIRVNSKTLNENIRERQLAVERQKQAIAQLSRAIQVQKERQQVAQRAAAERHQLAQKQNDPDRRVNSASDYAKEAVEMRYLLEPIRNNNAPSFNFSKYRTGSFLQKIYNGTFEGFPYDLRDMQTQNLEMGLKKTSVIKKRTAFAYAYLSHFSEHCAKPNKENYKEFRSQYKYTETNDYGMETETIGKATYYYLKPQFYNDFVRMDKNYAADQGLGAIFLLTSMDDILKNFPSDLEQLFAELDCNDPILKQLETNLVLASKGKPPIQKLLKHLN